MKTLGLLTMSLALMATFSPATARVWDFWIGDHPGLCTLPDEPFGPPCPVVAESARGARMVIEGRGKFGTHPKSVCVDTGCKYDPTSDLLDPECLVDGDGFEVPSNRFRLLEPDGEGSFVEVDSGTWMADALLSMQEYGGEIAAFPGLPCGSEGGQTIIRLTLFGQERAYKGKMTMYCMIGNRFDDPLTGAFPPGNHPFDAAFPPNEKPAETVLLQIQGGENYQRKGTGLTLYINISDPSDSTPQMCVPREALGAPFSTGLPTSPSCELGG